MGYIRHFDKLWEYENREHNSSCLHESWFRFHTHELIRGAHKPLQVVLNLITDLISRDILWWLNGSVVDCKCYKNSQLQLRQCTLTLEMCFAFLYNLKFNKMIQIISKFINDFRKHESRSLCNWCKQVDEQVPIKPPILCIFYGVKINKFNLILNGNKSRNWNEVTYPMAFNTVHNFLHPINRRPSKYLLLSLMYPV